MKISQHRLYHDDNTPYSFIASPNVGGLLQPRYLVMHYTAGRSVEQAISWLTDTERQVSAHLVIGREGSITQLVPFNTIAWHAGQSTWQGLTGMNQYSIGIELDNAGALARVDDSWTAWFGDVYPDDQVIEMTHKHEIITRGWHIYSPAQITTTMQVAHLLVKTYQLIDVIGHEDIAPNRKIDPGPAFPMAIFRAHLFKNAQ